jgi:flagellar basal body-associated protein FliL
MPEVQMNTAPGSASSGDAGEASRGSSGSAASGSGLAKKKAAKSKSPLYLVVALAVAATGIYFWLRPAASTSADAHTEAESTLALDTFVVNLDGAGQRAYLRVGITLGLSRALPRKRDDVPIAPLRDAIPSVLSSAQPEQLLASEGKQKLKADLLQSLQERAPDLGIENVYFTEFLVQM